MGMNQSQWQIGVDEVGRGPLAGPVMVGAVMVSVEFDWRVLSDVRDSKQLSAEVREQIYVQAKQLARQGSLSFVVCRTLPGVIDKIGINPAIQRALNRALAEVVGQKAVQPTEVRVCLDGGLRAPSNFSNQITIIKGDATESAIGLASIVAKVTRDRYMSRLAARADYASYDFVSNKGYGTKAHRAAIAQYGLSPQHRRSYCRNIKVL